MIVKQADGYHIYSHDRKKHLGGPYSKAHAEKRLKQIEAFKHMKEDTNMGYKVVEKDGKWDLLDDSGKLVQTFQSKRVADSKCKDFNESLTEAKTPEEVKLFNKFEKQCANALDVTLPLPKDTPRSIRNKLYAMVSAKMKKSNIMKVMEALQEGTVKYELTPLEQKKLKQVAKITNLSFHALAARPETARNMINRVLGEDIEDMQESYYCIIGMKKR